MPIRAKGYIFFHLTLSIIFLLVILNSDYSLSLIKTIPFIIFGCLFEMLRLSAFTINGQEFTMSAGAAIILAAVILFNPLELFIFSLFYGIAILLYPLVKDPYKIIFNISQTINIIYITHLVWVSFDVNLDNLLAVENIIPLIVTMLVFVIFDILTISIIISLASESKLKDIIHDSLDWVTVSYFLIAFIGLVLAVMYKVFYIYGLIGFAIPLFLMRYNMYLFSKEKEKQVSQLIDFNEMLTHNNDQLILTLSQIVDAKDNSLYGHSETVSKYALEIGKRLMLSEERLEHLKRGALLHDIGKLSISENILKKPGRLTDDEFEIIKEHTLIGKNMIKELKGMERVAEIISQHHEHYSGKGYPYALKGEDILLEARIITLCDSVDTMLSTRSYKDGWSLKEVLEEVIKCKGTHFDPTIVDIFTVLVKEKGESYFSDSSKLRQEISITMGGTELSSETVL